MKRLSSREPMRNPQPSLPAPWRRRALVLVMAACALLVAATAVAREALPRAHGSDQPESTLQLATFDAVWAQVRSQYFDYARIEEAWLAARESLRPQAVNASPAQLRSLLNGMLELVGESHFLVLPPTELSAGPGNADSGDSGSDGDAGGETASAGGGGADTPGALDLRTTGLSVRLIDDEFLVTRVGEPNADVIEAGWKLVAIGESTLAEPLAAVLELTDPAARKRARLVLEFSVNSNIGYPAAGETPSLTFEDGAGETRTVELRTSATPVQVVQLGNLPAMAFSFEADVFEGDRGCVGRMAFSAWVPELMDRFLAARDALFACEGLLLDLRGNPGGVMTTMMPLASHLFTEITLLGQLTREDGRIDFRAFPRLVDDQGNRIAPFEGPVAILVDSLSASTSEMFASGMQALGRARVFGTPSPGMALPAQMLPLPNGDRLMYAFADYIDGMGRRIEGVGVSPDEPSPLSRADLLQGTDPAMTAALAWLQAEAERVP